MDSSRHTRRPASRALFRGVACAAVISMVSVAGPAPAARASASVVTGEASRVTDSGVHLTGTLAVAGPSTVGVFAISTTAEFTEPVYRYDGPWVPGMTLFVRMQGSAEMSFDLGSWTPNGDGPPLVASTTYFWRAGLQTGPDSCIFSVGCYVWGETKSFTTADPPGDAGGGEVAVAASVNPRTAVVASAVGSRAGVTVTLRARATGVRPVSAQIRLSPNGPIRKVSLAGSASASRTITVPAARGTVSSVWVRTIDRAGRTSQWLVIRVRPGR